MGGRLPPNRDTAPVDTRDAEIRLHVYEQLAAGEPAPTPRTIAARFGTTPLAAAAALRRLQDDHDALVLLPGSPYLWMAEPFSAVPTDYPVAGAGRRWFGNCIWDALAVAALVDEPVVRIPAVCPATGLPLPLEVRDGELTAAPGVAHFAVPPRRWWESIGFT